MFKLTIFKIFIHCESVGASLGCWLNEWFNIYGKKAGEYFLFLSDIWALIKMNPRTVGGLCSGAWALPISWVPHYPLLNARFYKLTFVPLVPEFAHQTPHTSLMSPAQTFRELQPKYLHGDTVQNNSLRVCKGQEGGGQGGISFTDSPLNGFHTSHAAFVPSPHPINECVAQLQPPLHCRGGGERFCAKWMILCKMNALTRVNQGCRFASAVCQKMLTGGTFLLPYPCKSLNSNAVTFKKLMVASL